MVCFLGVGGMADGRAASDRFFECGSQLERRAAAGFRADSRSYHDNALLS